MHNSTTDYSNQLPSYWEVVDELTQTALPLTASGLHGRICGYISAGQRADGFAWLETLLRFKQQPSILLNLYRYSFEFITNMDFGFHLLLPSDDVTLPERAEALGEWCSGFIEGLAILGIRYDSSNNEELRDALFHMAEIGQLDYEDLTISEEDSRSFEEVYEYVRMAVLSLYAELGGKAGAVQLQPNLESETVH